MDYGRFARFVTPTSIVRSVLILMLLFALGRLPYDYYTLLRWAVCFGLFYVSAKANEPESRGWAYAFVAIGILFNPVVPVHLSRSTWAVVDLATAVFLAVSIALYRERP